MKFLELATKVLAEVNKPLSASEIWEFAHSKGYTNLLDTKGATPEYTLSARLYSAIGDTSNNKFGAVGERPKRFYLKGITPDMKVAQTQTDNPDPEFHLKSEYKERDLHCVLTYFIRNNFEGFAKTINHSTSKKKEYGEWTDPDMVACYFPRNHWKTNVYELSEMLGDPQLGFYSFEIKQRLGFYNLRESFFQAVSNSSWAHEGYLVTAEISNDVDFHQELRRLSRSFGIGVILLNVKNPDSSKILYTAGENDLVDWETVNKLSSMNKDFEDFVNRVKKDVSSKEVREEWYDELLEADQIMEKFERP
jgi:uncharacterized protein